MNKELSPRCSHTPTQRVVQANESTKIEISEVSDRKAIETPKNYSLKESDSNKIEIVGDAEKQAVGMI
jgi:hypothetical protein